MIGRLETTASSTAAATLPSMPADAPSPTPSTMPPPKRRANGGGSGANRNNKRRKNDDSNDSGNEAKRPAFGVGMVKGREDEWSEPADVKTKVDFLELPVDALYRYLEVNDLLPRWDVSPWSEAPCTPPTELYTIPPQAPVIPVESPKRDTPMAVDEPAAPEEKPEPEGEAQEGEEGDDTAAPTTRSKTAPLRKRTPDTPSHPPIKRGIMTLSDVHAARAVLADKANQHWMKGLGGGQNREGETIVNFLYKNKVGHGRLLRVYNPTPAPFS